MLGIDVSKRTLTCTLLDPATQRALWTRDVSNDAAGIDQLLRCTPATAPWTLEPTGRYSHTVAQRAVAAGRQVLLAPPKKAKAYLNSLQTRAKTDRLDSYGLGLFALSRPLPRYPLKTAMHEQVDQLLTARRGLSEAIAKLKQTSRELPAAAPQLKAALAALRQQRTSLDRQLRQLTQGTAAATPATTAIVHPEVAQDTGAAAPPAAASSPDVATNHVSALPSAATASAATASAATASAATASAATASAATAEGAALEAAVALLLEVPGIGPVTATTVASRLTARTFRRCHQFVAFCGLDVDIQQSGPRKGNLGLTKQGDAELRRLFYLAAQANLRKQGSPFAEQYQRERAKGLSSTAALNAVARKLARLSWSLVTHGQRYDPRRVYQQEAPAAGASVASQDEASRVVVAVAAAAAPEAVAATEPSQ